jgi:hypothetical protein
VGYFVKLISKITIFFMLSTPILALASNYMDDHAVKSAPLSLVIHNDYSDDHHHHYYSHVHDGDAHQHDGNDDHDHDSLDLHHVSISIYALPMSDGTSPFVASNNDRTHFLASPYRNKYPDFPERPPIA